MCLINTIVIVFCRNSEAMKGGQNNKVSRGGLCSPERGGGGAQDKKINCNNNGNHNNNNHGGGGSGSSEDSKKGGGSSSGSDAVPAIVWPPKFVIGLTNKEKEEDFLAIKGCKLPHRPKKRAKFVQRTLNVSTFSISFIYFLF